MRKYCQCSTDQPKILNKQSIISKVEPVETENNPIKSTLLFTLNKCNIFPHPEASITQLVSEGCKAAEMIYTSQGNCSELMIDSDENKIQRNKCIRIHEKQVNIIKEGNAENIEKILKMPKNGVKINKNESLYLCKLLVGTQRDLGCSVIKQSIEIMDKKIVRYGKEIISTRKQLEKLEYQEYQLLRLKGLLLADQNPLTSIRKLKNEHKISNNTSISTRSASLLEPYNPMSDTIF